MPTLVLLSLLAPAHAADRNVPGDYATITAAIGAANPGDTIVIAAGDYCEDVIITKSVDLEGAGPDLTMIDGTCGAGTAAVSTNSALTVSIRGLTIDGADRIVPFLVNWDSTITLTDVVLRHGYHNGNGGGLIFSEIYGYSNTSVDCERCVFCDNQATSDGGAVLIDGSGSQFYAQESVFIRNTAGDDGGAVDLRSASQSLTLLNNTFVGNSVTGGSSDGACVRFNGGTSVLANNLFQGNTGDTCLNQTGGTINFTSNNLFFSNNGGSTFAQTAPLFDDPLLVDIGTTCDDFDLQLQAGSPAIDAGTASGIFDDIGAFEFIDDADGDGQTVLEGDCDDDDPAINSAALELCDGVDNDCDGLIDDADGDVADAITSYDDADGDGYGDAATEVVECTLTPGNVTQAGDCDDAVATTNPDGDDSDCDGVDDDCVGGVDDKAAFTQYFRDDDGDGFGDAGDSRIECADPGAGWTTDDRDCDDAQAAVNPDADEVCNGGVDDDCNGRADDDDGGVTDPLTWYDDADGDGFGDPGDSEQACLAPNRHVADGTDCDDGDVDTYPGAPEVCGGGDDDCDGLVDDDDPDVTDPRSWWADNDDDGWGGAALPDACVQPANSVDRPGDCIDSNRDVNPDEDEVCNGIDDDCDGQVDLADPSLTDAITVWTDDDGDAYGSGASFEVCTVNGTHALEGGDCDDQRATVHPDAAELCDGLDNDCDGPIDEDVDFVDWYTDADGDGYGAEGSSPALNDCADPGPGFSTVATDCDDGNSAIEPGAIDDQCDGIDDDCDGVLDDDAPTNSTNELYSDSDGDGFGVDGIIGFGCPDDGLVPDDGDCDDTEPGVNPAAAEQCDNLIDDDCDGVVDEGCGGTDTADTSDTGLPTTGGNGTTGGGNGTTGGGNGTTGGGNGTTGGGNGTTGGGNGTTGGNGTSGSLTPVVGGSAAASKGCSCSTPAAPGGMAWLLGLGGLLGWRRRRSPAP